MIAAVQAALDHHRIDDRIEEVGQFQPRGQTGALFAGGMIGSELGGALGAVGDGIGLGAGSVGGIAANSASRGLPSRMLVGASASTIYGFKMANMGRTKEPHELLFHVPREGLERSEEHTSELQSRQYLVCRLLLEKKKLHRIFYSST